jgi:hypothetical protein
VRSMSGKSVKYCSVSLSALQLSWALRDSSSRGLMASWCPLMWLSVGWLSPSCCMAFLISAKTSHSEDTVAFGKMVVCLLIHITILIVADSAAQQRHRRNLLPIVNKEGRKLQTTLRYFGKPQRTASNERSQRRRSTSGSLFRSKVCKDDNERPHFHWC